MDLTNHEKILKKIGLTDLEAQIYLYVLKTGIVTVPEIHKTLKMDKSSTYRIVDNLVARKLITPIGEEYGKQFMAADPSYLKELAQKQRDESEVVFDEISDLVENLVSTSAKTYKNQNISVYEGDESYIKIMEKRLEAKPSMIREMDNAQVVADSEINYWSYVESFINRRVEAGINLKSIVRSEDRSQKFEQTDSDLLKEVRYLPKNFKIGASISTFDIYTTILNLKGDRKLGIIIKDPIISQVMTNLFDYIWKTLK